jgi:hypothetical protein
MPENDGSLGSISERAIGLYKKYRVERLDDPKGEHDNCLYFVLDIEHDAYAVHALSSYAHACRREYPELARDLDKLVIEGLIKWASKRGAK